MESLDPVHIRRSYFLKTMPASCFRLSTVDWFLNSRSRMLWYDPPRLRYATAVDFVCEAFGGRWVAADFLKAPPKDPLTTVRQLLSLDIDQDDQNWCFCIFLTGKPRTFLDCALQDHQTRAYFEARVTVACVFPIRFTRPWQWDSDDPTKASLFVLTVF